jgi:hypothetical protein
MTARIAWRLLLVMLVVSACAREDPARAELRARLKQETQLPPEELGRVLDEVRRTLEGKNVRFMQGAQEFKLDEQERAVVLGMLEIRAGVFDEGMRRDGGTTLRIINAPGRSAYSEHDATRRLLVDVETFVPRRFEFSYDVPGLGDYSFNLLVE